MSGRGVTPGATILLVENEPSVRIGMTAVLTGAGFHVIPAEHLEEVWTALETQPGVQVLLTDLDASGGIDGLELDLHRKSGELCMKQEDLHAEDPFYEGVSG